MNADHSGIILEGYNNGFIGGASGLTAPDTICFTGDTSGVINSDEIKALGRGSGWEMWLFPKGELACDPKGLGVAMVTEGGG